MKSTMIIGVFVTLCLGLISCDSQEEPVGFSDDVIQLSERALLVTVESNSSIVTTKGTGWWIEGIYLNDDWSYDLSTIDTTKDNFVIEHDPFTIARKNTTELHISMSQNDTGSQRVLFIGLQDGNYSDGITITQAAD